MRSSCSKPPADRKATVARSDAGNQPMTLALDSTSSAQSSYGFDVKLIKVARG